MIGEAPRNIHEAHTCNSELPDEVRRMASGHYVSALSYAFAQQPADSFPRRVHALNENGTFDICIAHSFQLTPELYGYYLLPEDKSSGEIRVAFRGTELDDGDALSKVKSMLINLEAWGPGMTSFEAEREGIFIKLKDAIQTHYNGKPPKLSLQVCGHSQGGALSQLFVTEFLRQRLMHDDFNAVESLTMTALNSPGVPYDIAEKCAERLKLQARIDKPLTVTINYGMVGGDPVQTFGLDMILATAPPELAEVNLMKVNKGFEGYWKKDLDLSDGLQPEEIVDIATNTTITTLGAHTNVNFFAPLGENACIQIDTMYTFYTNRNPNDIAPMAKELLNKALTLPAILFYVAQDVIKNSDPCQAVGFVSGQLSRLFQPFRTAKIAQENEKAPGPSMGPEASSRASTSYSN